MQVAILMIIGAAVTFHSSVCPQPARLVIERFHCPLLEHHLPGTTNLRDVKAR